MISSFFEESIIKRAQEKKLAKIEIVDLRAFAKNSYGSVDDKPYGGGAGMVLRVDILKQAIDNVKAQSSNVKTTGKNSKVVLTSAKGALFNQRKAQEFSKLEHLILIAGHYEGVDERVANLVDEEISIGDFVVTGGEIPIALIVDSIVRLLPGVLEKNTATQEESFFEVEVATLTGIVGNAERLNALEKKGVKKVRLLEYPHYTRPEEYDGKKVPEILLSGDHKKIQEWRLKKAFEETVKKRPDLLS